MRVHMSLSAVIAATSLAIAQTPRPPIEAFGSGCGGQGQPASIESTSLWPGQLATLHFHDLPANRAASLLLGGSNTQWGGLSLPVPLAGIGMPGCQLLVAVDNFLVFATGNGSPTFTFPVPLDPGLAAQDIYMQVLHEQPGLNAMGLATSIGLRARVSPLPTPTQAVTSITQFGITFQFAQPVQAGQFVNGDWFVIGPVTVVDMLPQSIDYSGRVINGAMVNPDPSTREQGYDGNMYLPGNEYLYIPAKNVAWGLDAAHPLVLHPNDSLVKTISNLNPNVIPDLETCSVLTCLAAPPPFGSFRPPYAGTDHQVRFDVQMLDYSALASLVPAPGMPNVAAQTAKFERPWLDHCPGWPSRYMHPALNMPDYGRDFTSLYNEAALLCNVTITPQERQLLVMRLVQIGIDFWGNVKNGCYWEGVGGQNSGRKLPILFAGALLRDAEMLGVGSLVSQRFLNGTYTIHFGEDGQTFYVQQTAPGVLNWGYGNYTQADVGVPEFGFSHVHWPASDHQGWFDDSYRRCCTANAWIGGVLCARIMGLVDEWNHPPLFDYMDRYVTVETTGWTKAWSTWCGSMWDQYRQFY